MSVSHLKRNRELCSVERKNKAFKKCNFIGFLFNLKYFYNSDALDEGTKKEI